MVAVVQAFIDSQSAWIGLAVLLVLFALFMSERLPPVIIAVAGAIGMLVLGYLPRERLEQVFANPAPITIGAMFILSGALIRTGVVEALASAAARRAELHPRLSLAELLGGSMAASGLVNNTPVVIVLLPIVRKVASVIGSSARRLLIPLSYLSIMGGTLTLLGSSTNLLVDGVAQRQGEAPFGIFEVTPIGLIAAAAGTAFLLLFGRWLLPRANDEEDDDEGSDTGARESLYVTEIVFGNDDDEIGAPYTTLRDLKRGGVRAAGVVRQGGEVLRNLEDLHIEAGDRLILHCDQAELMSMLRAHGENVGLAARRNPIAADSRVVEASIAPSHPALGRRLAEIPFLMRTDARILGLARARHLAGPTLSEVKLRPADSILVAGDDAAIRAIERNVNLIHIEEPTAQPFRRLKAPIAILTMLGVIALAATGIVNIELAAIIGVAVVLVSRCIDPEEAWASIDGNVLVLIFGMLGVGIGLQEAGTVDLIVDAVLPVIESAPFFLLLLAVYALTSVLTELVTNNAVAVIMTPIVLTLAESMGLDARPLLLAVMFAASASFATPIGYQTNTIVYAAGNYSFSDFLRIGIPMNLVVGLATCAAIAALT